MPCFPSLHVFRSFSLKRFLGALMVGLLWAHLIHADEDTRWKKIEVVPSSVALVGRDAMQQVLVQGQTDTGRWVD